MANPYQTSPTPVSVHPIQFQPPSPPPSERVHVPQIQATWWTLPVRIDHASPLAGLMLQSPHSIMYQNRLYPTALHLLEAFKFLKNRPDLSERIRAAKDAQDALTLSISFQDHVREDWRRISRTSLEDVLYMKLEQYADLRGLLLGTGDAPIVYSEEGDISWVESANEPGRALEKVRERLRKNGMGLGNSGGVQDIGRSGGITTGPNSRPSTPFASASGFR